MPLQDSAQLATLDTLREYAQRLTDAKHGERAQVLADAFRLLGWKKDKLYRELKKVGWSSGKAKRKDAGTTSQDGQALDKLAATLRLGVRANGKATMETPNGRSLLATNGVEFAVSNSRLNDLLRRRRQDLTSARQDAPATPMRSSHPNHVHQVDPSLCLLYYLPNGEQHVQRFMSDDEFYQNKPENWDKVENLRVWRYVLTDHKSAIIIVRYYQAKGETQANLWDFLLFCWRRREGRPFHGAPKILIWDKGSANKASAIKNGLKAMEVQQIPHERGNPRAKGQVENANNLVEKLFESRLRYEPVRTVEELNAAAEAWYNAYNANSIPHYDSRLKRRGMERPVARYELWQMIRAEQLRILEGEEAVWRGLATADAVSRKVDSSLSVSFRHPLTKRSETYDLRELPVVKGQQVQVAPRMLGGSTGEVIVTVEDFQGEEQSFAVRPVAMDPIFGGRSDAPVFGEEHRSHADTAVEKGAKAAERAAFPDLDAIGRNDTPFGGLDAHSHLGKVELPTYLRRPGQEIDLGQRPAISTPPLAVVPALMRLSGLLGRALSPEENAAFRSSYPDGIQEEDLPAVADRLRAGLPLGAEAEEIQQTTRPRLAVVR